MTNGKFSIAIGDMLTGAIVGLEQVRIGGPQCRARHCQRGGHELHGGAPGNGATAVKTGNNYKITGTASGVDASGQQVSKDFTVDVTCP